MPLSDWIQTGVLLATTLAVGIAAWQTFLQNRLPKAQLLRDRFEMYWQTYQPVSQEQIAALKLYPEDYVGLDRYASRYEGDDNAIARYINTSRLYEYLAFTYTLHHVLKVPDPVGSGWVARWTKNLAKSVEFQDVRKSYSGYYPEFESFVDGLLRERQEALS
jgi:hypothetical protein